MRIVFYFAPSERRGAGVLTDLTPFEFWEYTRKHWYSDILVMNTMDVPAADVQRLRTTGNVVTLFRSEISKKGL